MTLAYSKSLGPGLLSLALCGSSLGFAASASAYSTASPVSAGCHEKITMQALRAVRRDTPLAAPIRPNSNEKAMIDDVPFDLDSDMHDVAAVALILANREVDLRGSAPDDLDTLATVHGDPNLQDEHCLRNQREDEPDGSEQALADCRAFLSSKLDEALDGLSSWSDGPDTNERVEVSLFLELRGRVDVNLPRFYVSMGQALHTIQDSFSHTYRNRDDQHRITTILNYIDLVDKDMKESRDGPPHSSELDKCEGLDELRRARLDLATQASYDVMMAVLAPVQTREQKVSAVNAALDQYLTFEPGCNAANHWCDAPESKYAVERGCICSAALAARSRSSGLWASSAALVWLGAMRRRRRARAPRARTLFGMGAFLGCALHPAAARAQLGVDPENTPPSPPPSDPAPNAPSSAPSVDGNTATPGVVDATPVNDAVEPFPFGGYVSASGSIEKGAVAVSAGVRYRLGSHWLVGIDGEYNPWFSIRTFDLKPGATNLYAVGVLRFPLRFQRVNLRTTLELGVSRMNFDLYGVPKGSVGPFVGFNLLGIDVELSRSLYLVVNPAHIALPIPQTEGVPYVYPQYRFTIGFQFGA